MENLTRRELLSTAALVGGWCFLGAERGAARQTPPAGAAPAGGPYTLPPLPYDYADLEPYIDAQTVKLHHDVHHAGYVRAANAAIAALEHVRRVGGEAVRQVRELTDRLAYNLSGHLLHTIYWTNMKRDGGGRPKADGQLGRLIKRDFGSFEAFAGSFQAAAQQVQGCGWGILAWEPLAQRLLVLQAEKHQNGTCWGAIPLLVVDVWEHAYYLRYQNKRSSYIKAFMNVVDWDNVEKRLERARELKPVDRT